MKAFVAGATGVLGRRVVRSLVTAGVETTGIGRTPGRRAELAEAGALAVELDLFARIGGDREPSQVTMWCSIWQRPFRSAAERTGLGHGARTTASAERGPGTWSTPRWRQGRAPTCRSRSRSCTQTAATSTSTSPRRSMRRTSPTPRSSARPKPRGSPSTAERASPCGSVSSTATTADIPSLR